LKGSYYVFPIQIDKLACWHRSSMLPVTCK
jgi:hypothetical protein